MNSLIRSLIRETLLTEEVYGAQAIVYHGTQADPQKLISSLLYKAKIASGETKPSQEELEKEFKPGIGAGAMYGKGLYAVYDLKRLEKGSYTNTKTAAGEYGPSIIKLKVSLYGYIIFDPFVASTVYKKPLSVVEQAEMLGLDKKLVEKLKNVRTEGRQYSSEAALEASKFLKGRVKGLVYTGFRDGRCILAYDATTVAPVAWKVIADKSWTPVDRNSLKTYFRRRASEDWQEEKYEISVKRALSNFQNLPVEERILKGDFSFYDSGIKSLPAGLKVEGSLNFSNSEVESLPAGLEVSGDLWLSNSKIKSLPVGLEVGGDLWLSNSKIKSLPVGLEVGGNFRLDNSKVVSLPPGLKVGGHLNISNSKVESLPDNLKIGGNLIVRDSNVTSLPNNLRVGGDLILRDSNVTSFPANIRVDGSFSLMYSKVESLPAGLNKIYGNFSLHGSAVTSLPAGLKVAGDLNLADSEITSIPAGLEVGGDLNLNYSKITSLPAGFKVGGSIYLKDSKVVSLPSDLEVGGYIYSFEGDRSQIPQHLKRKLR